MRLSTDEDAKQKDATAALHALASFKPRNELEGMIAAQIVAAHFAAMDCYRRAMSGQVTLRTTSLTEANKLSRTFATLVEALDAHRGKGARQHMPVKHVHVYAGGQAVVGNVDLPAGG